MTIAEELAETRERVRQGIALACAMERRDRERRAEQRATQDRRVRGTLEPCGAVMPGLWQPTQCTLAAHAAGRHTDEKRGISWAAA